MSSRTAAEIPPKLWKQYSPFQTVVDAHSASDYASDAKGVAVVIAKELKVRFGASKVKLFGSLARGDFNRWSDIDLAIWDLNSADYYRAVAFATGFSNLFKVDLVDIDDCSESLRQHILREGVEL
jgi:predicted nucleotidyltransferase